MDYQFLKILFMIGLVLVLVTSIGCLNYLSVSLYNRSFIHHPWVCYLFGLSGLVLLIAVLFGFHSIQATIS